MEYITYKELQNKIDLGFKILWIGSLSDTEVSIRLYNTTQDKLFKFDTAQLKAPNKARIIQHNEATSKPLSFIGITWQKFGWLKSIRVEIGRAHV